MQFLSKAVRHMAERLFGFCNEVSLLTVPAHHARGVLASISQSDRVALAGDHCEMDVKDVTGNSALADELQNQRNRCSDINP